jgi:hypothetical protein
VFRSDSQADSFRQPNADARFTTSCYAEAQHLGQLLDRQQYALAAVGCSRSVRRKLSGKALTGPELAAAWTDWTRRHPDRAEVIRYLI